MRDWKTVRLEEYLTFRNGKKSPEREPSGCFPVYGSNGIIGFCSMNNTSANTITIGRVGAYCGSVYFSSVPSWVTDNAIIAEPYSPEEARFWYYVLSWLNLNTYTHGSAQPLINQTILRNITIKIPCKEKRLAIAEVLSSLDDQIELLTKQNETLDALLLNSFLHRVQNEDPSENDDFIALDKEIDFLNGLACQKYAPISDNKLPVIKIKELNAGGFSKDSNFCRDDVPSKYLVHFGDIIFSWSGTLVVKLWPNEPGVLNQHLFKVTSDLYPDWFIFCWLKYHLPVFQEIARGKATTMGHIQRHHLSEAMITEKNLLDDASFVELQEDLFNKLKANDLLIYQLRRTRDALIPQLMSGALRVTDAKRVIAEEVSHA